MKMPGIPALAERRRVRYVCCCKGCGLQGEAPWIVLTGFMDMKKALAVIAVALFCSGFAAMAQKVTGSFEALRDAGRVKMVIEFAEADIMGMTEEQFSEYETDWEKDKPGLLSLFYSYANRALKGALTVGSYNFDTDCTLTLVVRSVTSKGDYDCDLILTEGGEECGRIIGLYAPGGVFGTKLNLMKDGAKHTGVAIGRLLLKEIR